jgi:hypothetical protein
MIEFTIQVSNELATRLKPVQDQLEQVLELGLQELSPTQSLVYTEVITFLASGPSPDQIVALRPSVTAQERLRDLLAKNQAGRLSEAESEELDEYQNLNHLMTLLKAQARRQIIIASNNVKRFGKCTDLGFGNKAKDDHEQEHEGDG